MSCDHELANEKTRCSVKNASYITTKIKIIETRDCGQKFDELNHSHISEKSAQTLINYSNHGVSVPSPIEFEVMKIYTHEETIVTCRKKHNWRNTHLVNSWHGLLFGHLFFARIWHFLNLIGNIMDYKTTQSLLFNIHGNISCSFKNLEIVTSSVRENASFGRSENNGLRHNHNMITMAMSIFKTLNMAAECGEM